MLYTAYAMCPWISFESLTVAIFFIFKPVYCSPARLVQPGPGKTHEFKRLSLDVTDSHCITEPDVLYYKAGSRADQFGL
jgi:hypothetical protein